MIDWSLEPGFCASSARNRGSPFLFVLFQWQRELFELTVEHAIQRQGSGCSVGQWVGARLLEGYYSTIDTTL